MINIAVEGASDVEIARAVARAAGHSVNLIRVAGGVSKLDPLIPKYNQASTQQPWVVFRDSDGECPVELRARLSSLCPHPHKNFSLRIAHTMAEAWLLSDREAFATFFGVPLVRIPHGAEDLLHAKKTLIELCSHSTSRLIRGDMVSGVAGVGPLYVSRINDFAKNSWRVSTAQKASESLNRAVLRISQLPTGL